MRISLELVVVAIIILVVAVVVLSIFGGSIGQFGTATDARINCINQGKWSCEATGTKPASWDTIFVFETQGGTKEKCSTLVGTWDNNVCKWDSTKKRWYWDQK